MKNSSYFLNALATGNSLEIQSIYKDCFPFVRKFVMQNKGNTEDAEDIFQKALLQIAVRYKKEKFEIKNTFEAYLYTVCKNLWRRELNKSKNRVTNNGVVELVTEEKDQAIAIVEQKRQELFTEKLQLISDNCKKILNLFFAKISYAEIAREYDYSSETVVRQRVFKCKKQLMGLIKKDHRYLSLVEV
ncbi:sigma-70 family RNA polymerase sigma factor [Pseudotenacibaculum sp. MALMAid0570]|uniref:RNA polymerase sigma factor n=1 Tax=Pseudotenacibaculum sp. MALMAid0570 TaxID=3143938 RepID=UPI0032DF8A10